MAQNVQITAGSGTAIAADLITGDASLGTADVQYIKLMDGTIGGTNKATVKAANAPAVAGDPALVVAISPNGQNTNGIALAAASAPVVLASNVANAVGVTATVAVTVPGVTTTTYASGREVGTLMTFTPVGRTLPGNSSGILVDVTLTANVVLTNEFDIYWFDSNPSNTTWTDNSAPAINSADISKLRGITKLTKNYSGLGTHTLYKPDLTTWSLMPYSGTVLYGIIVAPAGTSAALAASALVVTVQTKED